jgi:integrase
MTGCRYGELIALTVADFDPAAGTVCVRQSKSGKPRYVALSEEGVEHFSVVSHDRQRSEYIFIKSNGLRWSRSEQQRPFLAACDAAKLADVRFHGLRHTYASRLVMKGAPLAVVAAQLGHSDTRMVEKHYGHLAPNYVRDTVRSLYSRIGIAQSDNVVTFPKVSA